MYERFSESARRAMSRARQLAKEHDCVVIVVEHVLLGVLTELDCHAVRYLELQGLDLAALRMGAKNAAANSVSHLPKRPKTFREAVWRFLNPIRTTPSLNHVVVTAMEEARSIRAKEVTTLHLLMGILTGDSPAGALLSAAGVEVGRLQAAIQEEARECVSAERGP